MSRSLRTGYGAGLIVAAILAGSAVTAAAPASAVAGFAIRGTNGGDVPTDAEYGAYVASVIAGVGLDVVPGASGGGDILDYPATFWPVSKGGFGDPTWDQSVAAGVNSLGLAIVASGDNEILVAGQSQGAVVASLFKAANPAPAQTITYVLLSNPSRPNGGVLERFDGLRIPILDVTFRGATPVAGGQTYDVGRQYDGWSDFPKYPLNILSTINAIAGTIYLHGVKNQVAQVDFSALNDPRKADVVVDGDTTYYTTATGRLPMLQIFESFVPSPILTALDAPLRVMVEWGYDRQASPGESTGISLLRFGSPIQETANLLHAVKVGIDDGLAEAAGDPDFRPLGTESAGMYGVGGRESSPAPAQADPKLNIKLGAQDAPNAAPQADPATSQRGPRKLGHGKAAVSTRRHSSRMVQSAAG